MMLLRYTSIIILSLFLAGCGRDAYYQAIKEQNITTQLRMENERLIREDKKLRHEKDMVALIEKLSVATGKTENTNDDLLASVMLMMTQDKNNMADLAYNLTKKDTPLQVIEAPDSFGDTIQKSTGLLVGGAAIALGIVQSNNMAEIATAGINSAGTHVSGTGNITTTGNASSSITSTATGDGASATLISASTANSTSADNTSTNTQN